MGNYNNCRKGQTGEDEENEVDGSDVDTSLTPFD
jgi:hypothetical protein